MEDKRTTRKHMEEKYTQSDIYKLNIGWEKTMIQGMEQVKEQTLKDELSFLKSLLKRVFDKSLIIILEKRIEYIKIKLNKIKGE